MTGRSPVVRVVRAFACAIVTLVSLVLFPSRADAYPWMIRHGYTQCATCHADPAGGGLLTPYGRAQGEILMRMRYGSAPDREPGPLAEPLLGLFEPPRGLLLGGDGRWAYVRRMPLQGDAAGRFILMQADLLGQYAIGRFRANASVGFVSEGGNGAAVTTGVDEKLVSRAHWLGVDLGARREVLVRAGRMNVPFGLRSIEHTMFTRLETRTDINTGQQHGVAADYHRGRLRAGAMAILGNFQIQEDRFRSRGYAAYGEYALTPTAAIGASSMATQTKLDIALLTPTWRHAHGLFGRYSPIRPVVVSAEADLLHTSQPTPGTTFVGGVAMVSADLEAVQGLHLGPTFEILDRDFDTSSASYGLWASAWWFFLPHADLRFDVITQRLATPAGATRVLSAIAQVHVYL